LTAEQVRVPFGVELVQVTPSAIAMAFEKAASRVLPVVPAIDGRPAPGYIVGAMTSDPASVEVVGPESAVKRATEAMTEPVSIAGAREIVQEIVTIGVMDSALRVKNPRPASVTVQIVPAPLERTIRNRALHLRNVGPLLQARAEPTAVDVTVRGSRETLNDVDPDDVVAYLDLSGLGAGEYTLSPHSDGSQDAGVVRIEPASVKVRITSDKR
jgi:YbbR domain-containing protein